MTPSRAAQMPTEKAGRTKVCCFRLWFCVQRGACSSYSEGGGSALVRRRIQTPSDAKVLSVVQPEEEVVLGASPPARPLEESGSEPTPASRHRPRLIYLDSAHGQDARGDQWLRSDRQELLSRAARAWWGFRDRGYQRPRRRQDHGASSEVRLRPRTAERGRRGWRRGHQGG